ncbi:ImuA family protein [Anianabacter salinae]|uniref:ImuA family protein n=1 Tax=Anianabacter salinae TaxID=2851023 RepID=UPI00225E000B|nr:hypothetical protein [Anianabacter salinae]
MSTVPLTRASHREETRPMLEVSGELRLALARVHEAAGPARRTLALIVAGALRGPVIWIVPGWQADRLCGAAMTRFCDPGRLVIFTPHRAEDMLWTMEEALRSGAAPLVVADLPEPPGLTPVRRLHLAAETGSGAGGVRPLGLILTPDRGGAQGIETRWHLLEAHEPHQDAWTLTRLRARAEPPKHWTVVPGPNGIALAEGERPGAGIEPAWGVRDVPSRALPSIS